MPWGGACGSGSGSGWAAWAERGPSRAPHSDTVLGPDIFSNKENKSPCFLSEDKQWDPHQQGRASTAQPALQGPGSHCQGRGAQPGRLCAPQQRAGDASWEPSNQSHLTPCARAAVTIKGSPRRLPSEHWHCGPEHPPLGLRCNYRVGLPRETGIGIVQSCARPRLPMPSPCLLGQVSPVLPWDPSSCPAWAQRGKVLGRGPGLPLGVLGGGLGEQGHLLSLPHRVQLDGQVCPDCLACHCPGATGYRFGAGHGL